MDIPDDEIVEEVDIEKSLHDSARIDDPVMLVEGLIVRPVHPVEYIEQSICAKEEDIVSR